MGRQSPSMTYSVASVCRTRSSLFLSVTSLERGRVNTEESAEGAQDRFLGTMGPPKAAISLLQRARLWRGALSSAPSAGVSRASLVHRQRPPPKAFAVESLDGLGRVLRARHLDEGEPSRLARRPVRDDRDILDLPPPFAKERS